MKQLFNRISISPTDIVIKATSSANLRSVSHSPSMLIPLLYKSSFLNTSSMAARARSVGRMFQIRILVCLTTLIQLLGHIHHTVGDIAECDSNPCLNNGTCTEGSDMWECDCPEGYYGMRCEVDLSGCVNSPCNESQGVCEATVGGYQCHCYPGYSGINCESDDDECTSDPCQNGATCTHLVDSFLCDCAGGYTGDLCETEINECDSSPCINGGVCVNLIDLYQCTCESGFTGQHCETDIDHCADSPCGDNGICVDDVNNYVCSCFSGFAGTRCQVRSTCARPLEIPVGTEFVEPEYTFFYGEALTVVCISSGAATVWICNGFNNWDKHELVCKTDSAITTLTAFTVLFAIILLIIIVGCVVYAGWRRRLGSFNMSMGNPKGGTVRMTENQVHIENGGVTNPRCSETTSGVDHKQVPSLPDKDTHRDDNTFVTNGGPIANMDSSFLSTKDDVPLNP